MRIIFWQPINSMHQAAVLALLARDHGHEVHLVARRDLGERTGTGWTVPDISPAVFHDLDGVLPEELLDRLHTAGGDAISIFSNPFGDALHRRLWRRCDRRGQAFGFHQARPGTYSSPLARCARGLLYRSAFRFLGRRTRVILCNGTACSSWLAARGFPRGKLADWGYFPAFSTTGERPARAPDGAFHVLYAGRLAPVKRVPWAIEAVAAARRRHPGTTLTVLGDGPLASEVDALGVARLGPAYRRSPFVPHDQVRAFMQAADCLLLPSIQEEWGAVVNEALIAGTPVVCSANCGAKDILAGGGGLVFAPDSPAGLEAALAAYLDDPARHARDRLRCAEIAPRIMPAAAAAYLDAVIINACAGAPLPTAPWLAAAEGGAS